MAEEADEEADEEAEAARAHLFCFVSIIYPINSEMVNYHQLVTLEIERVG